MGMAFSVARFLAATDALQMQDLIHVFMNGRLAQTDPFSFQKHTHRAMAYDPVDFVVDRFDLIEYLFSLGFILCFPLLKVVEVSVHADAHMSE
jgi:hypothetical protein